MVETTPGTDGGVVVGEDGLARPVWAAGDPLLREYYDSEWGMPVTDERGVYERICLEAFQAGLSWATILRKRPAFREAFDDFDPDVVAGYTEADVERLLRGCRDVGEVPWLRRGGGFEGPDESADPALGP